MVTYAKGFLRLFNWVAHGWEGELDQSAIFAKQTTPEVTGLKSNKHLFLLLWVPVVVGSSGLGLFGKSASSIDPSRLGSFMQISLRSFLHVLFLGPKGKK